MPVDKSAMQWQSVRIQILYIDWNNHFNWNLKAGLMLIKELDEQKCSDVQKQKN